MGAFLELVALFLESLCVPARSECQRMVPYFLAGGASFACDVTPFVGCQRLVNGRLQVFDKEHIQLVS